MGRGKKNRVLLLISVISLTVLLVGVFLISIKATQVWKDRNTWDIESRISFPEETAKLKVKNEVGEIQSNGEQSFYFEAEYCYLYEIEATKDIATLKFSLLPMYYAQRETEVPKDWKEKSDIYVVIRPNDVQPTEFLGRINKSFVSVSSLGAKKYPVKLSISGSTQYPQDNLFNKVQHLLYVIQQKSQPLEVELSSYRVERLDTVTPEQKRIYAEAKVPEIWREIERHVGIDYKAVSDQQKLINSYRDIFTQYREVCTNLSQCEYGYKSNPGDQFIYYLYLLRSRDIKKYDFLLTAIKKLYPFVPKTASSEVSCEACEDNWTQIAPGMFPVCPVNDVISGKVSSNVSFLFAKMDSRGDKSLLPTSEAQALALLMKYSPSSFESIGMWDADQIVGINYACYYVLKQGIESKTELSRKLVENYYNMVATMLGVPLTTDRSTFDNIIYESNAYSPYRTTLALDYAVMRDRESGLELMPDASSRYTDIRSLWNTLILLYLYEE